MVNANADRKLTAAGLRLIAEFEGFRADLYNDAAGHATVGYGHLVHEGPVDGSEPEEFRDGINEERALEILRQDAEIACRGVRELVTVALTQNQFDALVSFVFNLGADQIAGSTLIKRLNQSDFEAVPGELLKWAMAGGVFLKGLQDRREREGELFLTPATDDQEEEWLQMATREEVTQAAREGVLNAPNFPLTVGQGPLFQSYSELFIKVSQVLGAIDQIKTQMATLSGKIDAIAQRVP